MSRFFSIKPGMTLKGREFRGLRGWAGKPLRPPLTDFPIVCYVLTALFDIISYYKADGGGTAHQSAARDLFVAATYVIIAGAIVSLGAALTGFGIGGRVWIGILRPAFLARLSVHRFGALQTGIWR
jgi:hypothetical protein